LIDPLLLRATIADHKGDGKGVQSDELNFHDNIERIHVNDLSHEEFMKKYVYGDKPVVIRGVTDDWPAKKEWKIKKLIEKYGEAKFKVAESNSGRKIRIPLKEYIEYCLYNRDDSPLYLFESNIENHPEGFALLSDYKPPKYFNHNLFDLVHRDIRPPNKWFLIGPKRSGSRMH